MINHFFKSTIKTLTKHFGIGNCWAITGSANLAIRKAKLNPLDIDIITVRSLADSVAESTRDILGLDLSFSQGKTIRSYYARTITLNVSVEIMADVEIFTKYKKWQKVEINNEQIELVENLGFLTQLTSLSHERLVYSLLGDQEKVDIINSIDGAKE